MHTTPPYRLLFNNDATNVGGCVSPFRQKGCEFSDERLAASITEAAAAGADCVILAPGLGWIPWWKSQVDGDHYARWQTRTHRELDQYGRYMMAGGDMVRTHLDTCRGLGIGCFVSLRMNDVHMQERHSTEDALSIWVCRFYREHLDCLIEAQHHQIAGYYNRRGLDWGRAPVRDYKLSLVRELCAYPVDGLELDFLRDDHLFADTVPIPERLDLISGFCAQVRALLDQAPGGGVGRRHLSVRIPHDPARHAESGIDVARLHAAGVDMFNCSGWYDTTQRSDGVRHVRAQAPQAAVYCELTHCAGFHPYFLQSVRYGTSGNPRLSDCQFYTSARQALEAGAHGLSLFNFVYYRQIEGVEALDAVCCEPPFHVLKHLLDPAFLATQPGHYHLGGTSYFRQVPRTLGPGAQESFEFELVAHPEAFAARLRVHSRSPLGEDTQLAASCNGVVCTPSAQTHRHFGNPFDPLVSPAGHRLAFIIPLEALQPGLNTLRLHQQGTATLDVVYLDLGIDTKQPQAALQDWSQA